MVFLIVVGIFAYFALVMLLLKWWLNFTFKRQWFEAWVAGAFIVIGASVGGVIQLIVWQSH